MTRDTFRNHWSRWGRGPLVALALGLAGWLAVSSCGESAGPTAPDRAAVASPSVVDAGPSAAPSVAAEASVDARSPFEPSPLGTVGSDLIEFITRRVLTFLDPPVLTDPRHAEKSISASAGGFVELNGFRVDIPPHALAQNTVVTLDLPTELPAANYVVADFGPSGLTFEKPVQITMSLVGVNLLGQDLSKIKIWFWNGTQWTEPRGTATSTSVSRKTTHFSTYGARGIDTTSGG